MDNPYSKSIDLSKSTRDKELNEFFLNKVLCNKESTSSITLCFYYPKALF